MLLQGNILQAGTCTWHCYDLSSISCSGSSGHGGCGAVGTLNLSKSPFWKSSVDDTCIALRLDQVEAFHLHLNSIEPTIQFTIGRQMGVFYFWTPRSPATSMAPCLQKCTTREHAQINILTLSPTIPWHTSFQWSGHFSAELIHCVLL